MDHVGRPLHNWHIIIVSLIAWGSERFYFLIFGNEDLEVCSKLVLAQEHWSYGVRTGKGRRKVEVSGDGGKNQGMYHRVAVILKHGCLRGAGQQPSALTLEKWGKEPVS